MLDYTIRESFFINKFCACENGNNQEKRIKCFIDSYRTFLKYRNINLPNEIYQNLLKHNHISEIKLFSIVIDALYVGKKKHNNTDDENIRTTNFIAELTESAILYTFIANYIKTHPTFALDGPNLEGIKYNKELFGLT